PVTYIMCSFHIIFFRVFFLMIHLPPTPTLFPYTTLFRSLLGGGLRVRPTRERGDGLRRWTRGIPGPPAGPRARAGREPPGAGLQDRKSTRLNSSHVSISYAVFCLKKKKKKQKMQHLNNKV